MESGASKPTGFAVRDSGFRGFGIRLANPKSQIPNPESCPKPWRVPNRGHVFRRARPRGSGLPCRGEGRRGSVCEQPPLHGFVERRHRQRERVRHYEAPIDPGRAGRVSRRETEPRPSAGNEAALGLDGSAAPSVGKNVIAVASFDNTHANLVAFSISPDDTKIGYIAASGAPPAPTSGAFPMSRTGTTTTANDGCNPLAAGSLAGKVVLIRRGTCSFYQKAFDAQTAGAAGVVLYNNAAGFLSPTVARATTENIGSRRQHDDTTGRRANISRTTGPARMYNRARRDTPPARKS